MKVFVIWMQSRQIRLWLKVGFWFGFVLCIRLSSMLSLSSTQTSNIKLQTSNTNLKEKKTKVKIDLCFSVWFFRSTQKLTLESEFHTEMDRSSGRSRNRYRECGRRRRRRNHDGACWRRMCFLSAQCLDCCAKRITKKTHDWCLELLKRLALSVGMHKCVRKANAKRTIWNVCFGFIGALKVVSDVSDCGSESAPFFCHSMSSKLS